MPKLAVVTNIPSPYRLHEFRVLSQELENRGIDFEAIFLATTEAGRYWAFHTEQCGFPHEVIPGWAFSIKRKPFLFNPKAIWKQWRHPVTWLWLGGTWYLPTVVALSWLMPLRQKPWLLSWNESTDEDHHVLSTSFSRTSRRLLLSPYDGWIVPGQRATDYALGKLGRRSLPALRFANTVDETLYRDRVESLRPQRPALRHQYALSDDQIVCLWLARLSPEKGIIPFLDKIKDLEPSRYVILIAGEGPQRPEIESWLKQHPMDNVRLLGHHDLDTLLELYALADLLLLPSFSEPYGFAAVEALWAGLPLFLSNRVGAIPEVFEPNINGWMVDPDDAEQVRRAFQDVLSSGKTRLEEMGQHSLSLAIKSFNSRDCAAHFVDDLLAEFPPKR